MPLYDYECDTCEHKFEAFKPVSDMYIHDCPKCGEHTVSKLLSHVTVRKDMKYRDLTGESIWFPKEGSYFDPALRRTFHSIKEKKEFMDKNKIASDGSSDKPRNSLPAEAGKERTGNRVTVNL